VLASAQRIAAEKQVKLEWNGRELRYDSQRSEGFPTWVIGLLFLLFFVVLPALRTGRYGRRRGWYSAGGWGGGFGGFGGGFGGGSGGGGSSFGGFGGARAAAGGVARAGEPAPSASRIAAVPWARGGRGPSRKRLG